MEITPREATENEWAQETAARLKAMQTAKSKLKDHELVWLTFHRAAPTTTADKQLQTRIERLFKAEHALVVATAELDSRAAAVNALMTPYVRKRCESIGRLALEFDLAKLSSEDEAELRALLLEQKARKASSPPVPIELELPPGMGRSIKRDPA